MKPVPIADLTRTPSALSPRRWSNPLVLGVSLCLLACAGTPPPSPETQPKQAKKHAPVEDPEPYHVAPPPAYGNKVVLNDAPLEGR